MKPWGVCAWCGVPITTANYHHNRGDFYICWKCYNSSNGRIK